MRVCPQCGSRSQERICPTDGFPMVAESLFERSDTAPALVGRRFDDRYQVDELIGQGGMGWVFRATHLVMQQTVALKVMRRDVARDMSAVKRFSKEARDCSRLRHHNTIKVHDFGVSDDGYPYIVMEYLDGQPLSRLVRSAGALPFDRVVHVVTQICASLDEAHDLGLVHRDLKPANVFLTRVHHEADYVKVLDFGIAKTIGGETGESLTQSGMVIGTPKYLSPEQAQAKRLDRRSDLYSLGVMLYEMLAGVVPFQAPSTGALLAKQIYEPPPPLPDVVDGRRLPDGARALVAQLLEKDPARRPATAEEVARRLVGIRAAAHGEPNVESTLPLSGGETVTPTALLARDRDPSGTQPTPEPTGLEPTAPRGGRDGPGKTRAEGGPRRRGARRGVGVLGVGLLAAMAAVAVLVFALGSEPESASESAARQRGRRATASAGAGANAGPLTTASAARPDAGSAPDDRAAISSPAAADIAPQPSEDAPVAEDAVAEDAVAGDAVEEAPLSAPETAAVVAAGSAYGSADGAEKTPVTVRLVTRPRGVVAREGDRTLGRTAPFELELRPGEKRTVVLTRRGYEPQTVVLGPEDAPERAVRLRRVARAAAPAASPGATAGQKPKPPTQTYDIPPL